MAIIHRPFVASAPPPPPPSGWIRPSDWLNIVPPAPGTQEVIGLIEIENNNSNFVRVLCSGNYAVDWGDGNTVTQTTGIGIQHSYDFNNANLSSQLTSRGNKQALIRITPQAGSNLTQVEFNVRHNKGQLPAGTSVNWLEVVARVPNATSFTFSGSTANIRCLYLESVILLESNLTSAANMFRNCFALRNLVLNLGTNNLTSVNSMFSDCRALQNVPLFNTGSVTDFNAMFNNCEGIVTIPQFNTSSGTNFGSMFASCATLVTIPQLNTANGTNFATMFSGCVSLVTIPLLNTSLGTAFTSMFNGCTALRSIPALSLGAVTVASNVNTIVGGCVSLTDIGFTDIRWNINFANCKLAREEIVKVFNNLINVGAARTITIIANHGYGETSTAERAIASGKGWTPG